MKLTAVLQLLLLTVATVRAAPPPVANQEWYGSSRGAVQSHPMELKQSSLKETQFMMDFNDVKNLQQDEKFEGDKLRNQYIGRDFGKDPYLSDQEPNDFNRHVEDRPNHIPCHMRHTDQTFNSGNDQDFPVTDHQDLLYKREASSTTASPHLDVLNPVDKVYDAPIPELKGGVRKRAAESSSNATEEVRIQWVPPSEAMPASDDNAEKQSTAEPKQNNDHKEISPENAQPQEVADDKGTPKKRYAVDIQHSPQGHLRDLKRIAKSNGKIPKLTKFDEFTPWKDEVRRKRSEEAKNVSESSEVTTSTSAPNKRSLDKEEVSGDKELHENTNEDASKSSASGVTESAPSESKKARKRRSVEHDEATRSTSINPSSDAGAPTATPKESSLHVRRSSEHEEAPKDANEDTTIPSSLGVTESATSESMKARRRRSVEHDQTTTATFIKPSSEEGSSTPGPKENSPHVKRSTEHGEALKDAKEDAPVSFAPESSTTEPKNTRRRRSVEPDETTTFTSSEASSDEGASTPAPKENSLHVKRSTEKEEAQETKQDIADASAPGVTEPATSEPTKARKRRFAEHDESTTFTTNEPSSDEGAPTAGPKESSLHVKRSSEHQETPNDTKEDTTVPSSLCITESATSESMKARRRRSVEHDETTTSTSIKPNSDESSSTTGPKENSPHVKRSSEPEEALKDAKEDTSVSFAPESSTSEPKNTRRRRSVEPDETTTFTSSEASSDEGASTPAPKENSLHAKRSTENEEAQGTKQDIADASAPGVTEPATFEPSKARKRRFAEHDESTIFTTNEPSSDEGAPTAGSKESSLHVKRSSEHQETPNDTKEDTTVPSSLCITESATLESMKARRRRSVEHDETTTSTSIKPNSDESSSTTGPKENSPHVKRSSEPEEALKDAKEDTSGSFGPESSTSEPKNTRRRRSVEPDETTTFTSSEASSDEGATTLAPKENSPHVKRSSEHEESLKDIMEDASEPSSTSVTESATSEPKEARRRRSVDHDETTTPTFTKPSSDEGASTPAPKENNDHVNRSMEQEQTHQHTKQDAPESSSPGVAESTTPEPKKENRRRSVGDCHTTSAPNDNHDHVKRSVQHEATHQDIKEDTQDSTTLAGSTSETAEVPEIDVRRGRDTENGETTEANSDSIISPESADKKDEATEEKVKDESTREPILKREVSRKRRAAKLEDTSEVAKDSITTSNPSEKRAKRAAEQVLDCAPQKPDEFQEHARLEAKVMRDLNFSM
nr:unnamed protein product [Callosobruchus chinensis]